MYSPIPIKRSSKFGNNYWEAYSPKVKRNVRLFSDLEYDFWVLIETNPQVRAFCERPLKIEQMYEGKLMKVMFDMWVEWENKNEQFVEIRYSNKSDYSGQSVFLASKKCMKWQLKMHTYTCQIPWLTLRD